MSSRIFLAASALVAVLAAATLAFQDAKASVLSISRGAQATELTFPYSATVSTDDPAFHIIQTGDGIDGRFAITNPGNSRIALEGFHAGNGEAFLAWNTGLGKAASIVTSNESSQVPALQVSSDSLGTPFTGAASDIYAVNPNSTAPAEQVTNYGKGPVLKLDHRGTGGDLATFDTKGQDMGRVTREGRGVFESGVRTGAQGITEELKPDGATTSYAKGDVLVVSTSGDSHVKKSSSTYSRSVVGVVATEEGVLLTNACVNCSLSSMLSVGILGVFPVKVTAQNGMVHRGDLLATSSTAGAAMRATNFTTGTILGKSLGSFSGSSTGIVPAVISLQ
jgi:hypothetical protein